ncbi:MAG: hypothetical protein R3C05_31990 [Pirellulaceae bacterium]
MITKDLLRAIRNDLPMRLTVTRLGQHGPICKQSDGYFRFQCPHCSELRATVNPKNNLAHCFSCGRNTNNIDLLILCGHDFLPAVTILKGWLDQYRRDLGRVESIPSSSALGSQEARQTQEALETHV